MAGFCFFFNFDKNYKLKILGSSRNLKNRKYK